MEPFVLVLGFLYAATALLEGHVIAAAMFLAMTIGAVIGARTREYDRRRR